MWLIYLLTAIPLAVGFVVWRINSKITWWEWIGSTLVGFLVCLGVHAIMISSMTTDYETRSGNVTEITFEPYWRAHWQEWVSYTTTSTDSKGHIHTHHHRRLKTYDEPHPARWKAQTTYGHGVTKEYPIDEQFFHQLAKRINSKPLQVSTPSKPHLVEGDPNVYRGLNNASVIIPSVDSFYFENKVKASPSTCSFSTVPKDVKVFDYPTVQSNWVSNRLVGKAGQDFTISRWDELNSRLGSAKKVNLIAVGFTSENARLGTYQEAAWCRGKKNDLVICYGQGWSYCFGWTERDGIKRELEKIFLDNPAGDPIIPQIESKIRELYEIKDWRKFDYLTVEPPRSFYYVILGLMLVWHGLAWAFSLFNDTNRTAIKPTGSLSMMMADNTSEGLEPIAHSNASPQTRPSPGASSDVSSAD